MKKSRQNFPKLEKTPTQKLFCEMSKNRDLCSFFEGYFEKWCKNELAHFLNWTKKYNKNEKNHLKMIQLLEKINKEK
jgi:hypothetical protein